MNILLRAEKLYNAPGIDEPKAAVCFKYDHPGFHSHHKYNQTKLHLKNSSYLHLTNWKRSTSARPVVEHSLTTETAAKMK